MRQIIRSTARNAQPGDTVRIMTAAHVSTDGAQFAAGTEYRPISAGANADTGRIEQVVSIGAQRVTIAEVR